jgi:hypothetical protein
MIHQFHYWVYIQRKWNWFVKENLHSTDNCCAILNSREMEMTCANQLWTDKENILHICNKMVFRQQKNKMSFVTTWIELGIIMLNAYDILHMKRTTTWRHSYGVQKIDLRRPKMVARVGNQKS